MNLPLPERIRRDVVTTLNTIRVSSGYRQDLIAEDFRSHDQPVRDNYAVVMIESEMEVSMEDGTQLQSHRELRLSITAYVTESEDSDEPIDTRMAYIAADIEKVLCFTDESFHRNGLAVGTFIEMIEPTYTDSSIHAVTVTVNIQFRHQLNNPYEV